MNFQPARRKAVGGAGAAAGAAWRAIVITTALVAATALGTGAPVTAQAASQAAAPTQQGQLYAWVSDGWGGGTVTSQPAGIQCHQTAWDPYSDTYQEAPTGSCSATFPVGTSVTFTATPDPGSYLNGGPDPNSVTMRVGYNSVWVMFCPDDNLCSSW
ncbi:hypothetical protein [Kitasatospora sp. McL0602]|uniref:hypothetical protein n=1 Tax=Kitasatospora sp. McL0602 TaxID=3439530 RepID=UPI003F8B2E79